MMTIRFADDQAMVYIYIGGTNAGLQRMMDALKETSEGYGTRINRKKTKVMILSKYKKGIRIIIEGEQQVRQFCYLGSLITDDCRRHNLLRLTEE